MEISKERAQKKEGTSSSKVHPSSCLGAEIKDEKGGKCNQPTGEMKDRQNVNHKARSGLLLNRLKGEFLFGFEKFASSASD